MNECKHLAIFIPYDLETEMLLKLASIKFLLSFMFSIIWRKSVDYIMVFQPISSFSSDILLLIANAKSLADPSLILKFCSFSSMRCSYFEREVNSFSTFSRSDLVPDSLSVFICFLPPSKNWESYSIPKSLTSLLAISIELTYGFFFKPSRRTSIILSLIKLLLTYNFCKWFLPNMPSNSLKASSWPSLIG